jgi:hypothetical protein
VKTFLRNGGSVAKEKIQLFSSNVLLIHSISLWYLPYISSIMIERSVHAGAPSAHQDEQGNIYLDSGLRVSENIRTALRINLNLGDPRRKVRQFSTRMRLVALNYHIAGGGDSVPTASSFKKGHITMHYSTNVQGMKRRLKPAIINYNNVQQSEAVFRIDTKHFFSDGSVLALLHRVSEDQDLNNPLILLTPQN